MFLLRLLWLSLILLVTLFVGGCKKTSTQESSKPSNATTEVKIGGDDNLAPVVFDLKPSANSPGDAGYRIFDCRYEAQGKTARFRLQFKHGPFASTDFPIASGDGKFLSVAGSDNSALLQALKKALDAKTIPRHSSRVGELAFDVVVFGEHQSRVAGGFSDRPPGDWTTIKVFLPKGGDDAEVFMNLNPGLGKGEFAIKDSDYGDYLVRAFSRVL